MRAKMCTFPFLVIGFLNSPANAQQVNEGTQSGIRPYGSFSGSNFDRIDLLNGNLHLEIPVLEVPQRGGRTLTWKFVYNSMIWTRTYVPNPGPPRSGGRYFASSGQSPWIFANPFSWYVSSDNNTVQCAALPQQGSYQLLTNYAIHEPDGTLHPLPLQREMGSFSCLGETVSGPALDGSGLFYDDVTQTITLEDGTQISAGMKDTNGNQAGFSQDTFGINRMTVTDGPNVLFTTPLGVTRTAPQFRSYQFASSDGSTQTFRVDYEAIDVHSDVCRGIISSPCFERTTTDIVPHTFTLPNGRQYVLTWVNNSPEDLGQIDLPSGGAISYTYGDNYVPQPSHFSPLNASGRRAVVTRTVTVNGVASQWTYSGGTVTDPLGNSQVHVFGSVSPAGSPNHFSGMNYERSVTFYQGLPSGGKIIKTVQKDYAAEPSPFSIDVVFARLIRTTTTLDNGLTNKVETDFGDSFQYNANSAVCPCTGFRLNNPTEVREYDYGQGAAGSLLRRSDYAYLHRSNPAYADLNIVDRKNSVQVFDGAGTQKSQSQTEYDIYNHAGMPAMVASAAVQHDSNRGTNYFTRGNPTQVKRWRNTDGAFLLTTYQYDDAGNVIATSDPNGNITRYDYTDSWGNAACPPSGQSKAFATKITNVLNQIATRSYFSCSGRVASITDANSATTRMTYDPLNRLLSTTLPNGAATTNCYTDSGGATCAQNPPPFKIVTKIPVATTPNPLTKTVTLLFDGLGQSTQSQLNSDPDGTIFTDTSFDPYGRISTVSNPYRSKTESTYGVTTSIYDGLGRPCLVVPPDGTASPGNNCPTPPPSNDVFTTYAGNTSTVTDQAGKSRKFLMDALGRLTQVFEDPSGNNYETDYTYNLLGNLIKVDQKGGSTDTIKWRTRTFTYDSLSRLLCASNPENSSAPCPITASASYTPGTTGYTYDNNGNVLTKTTPAPNQTGTAAVTATYTYDALNRLAQKSFSDATPAIKYGYDAVAPSGCTPPALAITNAIGRRTSMCDAAGSEAWSYNSMGQPLIERRVTNSVTKSTSYTYNLDGSIATLTYPSGRNITYTLAASGNDTAGEMASGTDSANSINYTTAAHYTPAGALASLTNGGNLVSTFYYNNRLQPCRISVRSSGTAPSSCPDAGDAADIGDVLDMSYNFNLGAANNGNVTAITNNLDTTRSQNFSYDALNRLFIAQTTSTFATSPAHCWGEQFGYDPWGNFLNITGSSTAYTGCTQEAPNNLANGKNQLVGYCYDAAGNLILNAACPGGSFIPAYVYNADNQLTSTAGVTYTYDGDGKRVQKSGGGPGKLYWYGMGSDPLDETDAAGNTNNTAFHEFVFFDGKRIARRDYSNNVNYYFADHLGTARVVTNAAGTTLDDSDFYPFGGERSILSSSGNTYKFTGKERDPESGLDNFGARYENPSLGRFMSPDWSGTVQAIPYAKLDFPQSLNLYAYVQNNSLNFTDPTGHQDAPAKVPPKACDPDSDPKCANKLARETQEREREPQEKPEPKASIGERVGMGLDATANVIVGFPKAVGGAAALVVGTLGSEVGVGIPVAVAGAYDLAQGSGQLTSALYQAGGAITGNTTGVDSKVDQITVHTSVAGFVATKLNGGDAHAGAKWAAAEGVFTGGFRRELFKGIGKTIDTIMNLKDLVTK